MEDKLLQILSTLEYAEILRLKRDIDSGALLFQHVLNRKITELETSHRKHCAACGKDLQVERDDVYTLVFGEKTIRKKASFCGIDCLESFTTVIKDTKFEQFRER
jgi:hypothetical protein